MGSVNPPAYHCIVCTLAKIPFASLSKESQQRIVRNGRPTSQMSYLRARYMNSINLDIHDWMTGCDREKKLYCWPCLLFNTSEYDVWGKRGFTDFYYLPATLEHTKDVSHQAKSKTLKLWNETAAELSESSGEEDVECIPELDFLNASASELEEELDVKPNVEALNASMAFPQNLVAAPTEQCCEAADVGQLGRLESVRKDSAQPVVDSSKAVGENRCASNRSSPPQGRCPSPTECLARLYKQPLPELESDTMAQTAQTGAEKYQLKWHSHHQNIHVSLANLYKNNRYADVMLLTCDGDESHAIPAHKLILGTSSLYFANIFDKTNVPTNTTAYIVLPPDLTYRSMQVLIQYMYTGESTVSNDILNEVLRGGEILKIRGLWRNDSAKPSDTEGIAVDNSARFVSPVTVTMPVQAPHSRDPQQQSHSTTPLIQVNRHVAIDPGERRRRTSTEGAIARTLSKKNDETILQHRDYGAMVRTEELSDIQNRVQSSPPHADRQAPDKANDSCKASRDETVTQAPHDIPQELSFLNVKAEPVEWSDLRAGELALPENGVSARDVQDDNEPASAVSRTAVKSEELPTGNAVRSSPSTASPSPSTEPPAYSPLTCELCSETFSIPAEWVRHIEGHSETALHVLPKRRRRTAQAAATDETAALRCDLCSTYYVTPADWVRHVQNTHTETELAASNHRAMSSRRTCANKSNASKGTTAAGELSAQPDKLCNICNKSFPSYASMAIHKRTHTGEKPFHCEMCNKGFNVKSNLLRHMRTLHNHQDDATGSMSPHTDRESCSSD